MDPLRWLQDLELSARARALQESFARAVPDEEAFLALDHSSLKELGFDLLQDRLLVLKAVDELRKKRAAEAGDASAAEKIWTSSFRREGSIRPTEERASWLAARPSKRASEKLYLVLSFAWVAFLAAPLTNPAATKELLRGERELALVGALAAAPALLVPLLFPSGPDRKLALRDRHALKAFAWIATHTFLALSYYWHYLKTPLAPNVSLTSLSVRLNGVPLAAAAPLFLALASHLTFSSIILRRWRTTSLGRILPRVLRAPLSLVLALALAALSVAAASYVLMESSGACGKAPCADYLATLWRKADPAFLFQTLPGAAAAAACLAVASLAYSSYEEQAPASLSSAVLSSSAACMIELCLLDSARLAAAERGAGVQALSWVYKCIPFL
eukprot:tig00000158_g10215.t1